MPHTALLFFLCHGGAAYLYVKKRMSESKASNKEIAALFRLLGELMELHDENSFKIRSYMNAARQIEMLDRELSGMSAEEIRAIPGIGDAIQKKIAGILESGRLPLLDKYLGQTPPGILDLLQIKGLGSKKAGILWRKLGISTLDELLKAAETHQIAALKGFGPKTEENIIKSVNYYLSVRDKKLYAEMEGPLEELMQQLMQADGVIRVQQSGAIRRKNPVIEEVEVLVTSKSGTLNELKKHPLLDWSSFKEKEGTASIAWSRSLQVTACDQKGEALALFTGTTPEPVREHIRFDPKLPYLSERDIFKAAGLPYIIPEMREPALSFAYICSVKEEEIVKEKDIRGVIHMHSNYSDGTQSIREMALAAIERGYEYMLLTDHSQSAFYANGLSPARIKAQHEEIDRLNRELAPFRIFKGIESDILHDGSLDYTDDVLASFDLIIASIHSGLSMNREKATERLLKAVRNPFTDILGHMSGRLLLRREGYPIDHEAVIDACAEEGTVIEINANPHRLDMDWTHIPYALEKGLMLSINPDAHSARGIDDIRYGVYAARKGGLPGKRNLSSMPYEEFEDWIAQRKERKKRLAH